MSPWLIVASLAVAFLYMDLIALFGFQGFIANAINFLRITTSVSVLIWFLPGITKIFKVRPYPRGDYLHAGIICSWMSTVGFSISNAAGQIFDYPTSVYANPIAGALSLLLVIGGMFHQLAPGATASMKRALITVAIGIAVAAAVVFIAPLFR